MELFIVVLLLVLLPAGWFFIRFQKYKRGENRAKYFIKYHIENGMDVLEAFEMELRYELKINNVDLSENLIIEIAESMAEFTERMTLENVVELYSTFVYRYILRNGRNANLVHIEPQKIRYSLHNLNIKERQGYFSLLLDNPEEIEDKYPEKNTGVPHQEDPNEWYKRGLYVFMSCYLHAKEKTDAIQKISNKQREGLLQEIVMYSVMRAHCIIHEHSEESGLKCLDCFMENYIELFGSPTIEQEEYMSMWIDYTCANKERRLDTLERHLNDYHFISENPITTELLHSIEEQSEEIAITAIEDDVSTLKAKYDEIEKLLK